MRIISGEYKGFKFPEKNMPHARPTTDRAKEALFNVLDQRYYFEDMKVLDLYSGLGSIALEFCSRGVTDITAVDLNRKSVVYINEIVDKLNAPLKVRQAKCVSYLNQSEDKYTIIFADPPYNEKQEIDALIESMSTGDYLLPNGLFILEHKSMTQVAHPAIVETREYGQSTFSFFNFEDSNE